MKFWLSFNLKKKTIASLYNGLQGTTSRNLWWIARFWSSITFL